MLYRTGQVLFFWRTMLAGRSLVQFFFSLLIKSSTNSGLQRLIFSGFAESGYVGGNVTVPHKEAAFAAVADMEPAARAIGAVNTLWLDGTKLCGTNTDGFGLMRDLTNNLHEPLAGRDVLVLGAGGAARGIMGPLLAKTPRSVVVLNRTERRAAELAASFMQHGPVTALSAAQLNGRRFHVVINATSIGINGDVPESLWPRRPFAPGGLAYDLVYADVPTPFLRWASKQSAERMADGLGMLIEQAAESFVVWRGVRPETPSVFAMLRPES